MSSGPSDRKMTMAVSADGVGIMLVGERRRRRDGLLARPVSFICRVNLLQDLVSCRNQGRGRPIFCPNPSVRTLTTVF